MSDLYPYANRFDVNRRLPEHGRSHDDVIAELRAIASEEDAFWETGKCSGTIYCGDHDHYAFMNEAFGLFAHVNALQRDMCPSQTRFEGEIIAMALDLMHADGDADWVADNVDDDTVAIVGSAGNYGYGTIDPIAELGELALERGAGLHVDACLGGFILPFGQELGYDIPLFDFRIPVVTSISADTHKYGYAFKGTSTVLFRDKALRNAQYFFQTSWSGGKYCSPSMDGSRSGGLLAATWAAMVSLGREGYRRYARSIFETSSAMQDAVRSHPELRILGRPSFLFSFTSDEFDVYHVNDFMRTRGWRFNGQQYPNALHMAVTRPQTQPGVAGAFAADLADAVAYAREQHAAGASPVSGAIYGGFGETPTEEADALIRAVMTDLLDAMQAVPAP